MHVSQSITANTKKSINGVSLSPGAPWLIWALEQALYDVSTHIYKAFISPGGHNRL